ncbi:MAG: ribonuclease P protein component [Acidimicrobiia bacterium]|nr:ribonuclease P protein component [Acidimicrobiia bacterium]
MSKNIKIFRITSLTEFDQLKRGKFFKSDSLWFKYVIISKQEFVPLALSVAVSKKYGNAVARNLLKRRIKNAIYTYGIDEKVPGNILLLIGINRDCTEQINFEDVTKSINNFFMHIGSFETDNVV